jgi:CRP/FNR family cyclic AMP-dependent transcriptional regulator
MSATMLEQIIQMLQTVPFFTAIRRQELTALAAVCRARTFRTRQVIFHRDDPGDALHIVQTGKVRIGLLSPRGDEIILALFQSGDFFGELSLLDGLPRSATAVAIETTTTLTLGRPDFLRVLSETPEMAQRVISALTARLRHTDMLLGDAIFLNVAARVAKRLLEMARAQARDSRPGPPVLRVTQFELAAMVGATRESVNKELRALERRGLVDLGRGRVTLLKPDAMYPPGNW